MISTIVFEIDGVLFNKEDYKYSGLLELDKLIKKRYSIDGFYEVAMNLYKEGEINEFIHQVFINMKIPINNKMIHFLSNAYYSHIPNIQLLPDAKWVLANIKESVNLGIISDGLLDAQYNKVKALRLPEKFHSIILSDRFGRENWKPSNLPYQHLCMALQVQHKDCVYVSNNIEKDLITAKKLGWKTVHVKRPDIHSIEDISCEYKPHYLIDDLRDLTTIPELSHLFNKKFAPIDFKRSGI